MKRLLIAVAIATFPLAIAAQTTVGVGSASRSESESTAVSGSAARSNQGQQQSTLSNAQQAQDASNTNTVSPSQSVTINGTPIPTDTRSTVRYEGTTTQRSVPSVVGPVMNPTTPCTAAVTAGGSGVGFGLFIGSTLEDKECTRREFARVLIAVGQLDAGMAVLCGNEMVSKAAPAICKKVQLAMNDTPASVATAAPAPTTSTKAPEAVKAEGPRVGQVEKGSDGKSYRYNGQGWVPIATEDMNRGDKLVTSQIR